MKVGLTLGKYAPLHKGHEFVIETARSEMDHVIVMIYDCPETTSIPLATRAGWIRDLFPDVEVIECYNGPTVVGDTPEIKKMNEDYIVSVLGARVVTHFYSSEFYGDHVSKVLGAEDRRVDSARGRVPVSGTLVREDAFKCRSFISHRVYRDLVEKVALMGAPSTGKTTLAKALAASFGTQWMPEYGREYWEQRHVNRRLSPAQLVEIAEGHLAREDELLADCNRYLFVDTNPITTCLFALYYHGKAEPRLEELAREAESRYDCVFLCGDDIPYDDTWCRSGEANREEMQEKTIGELVRRGIAYTVLKGDLETRVALVQQTLRARAQRV